HYALGRGPAFERADVPDHTYIDGYHTEQAIATMREMLEGGSKPFFLGLGFRLPHLDWNAPARYWELYDSTRIAEEIGTIRPQDGAAMGLHASFELRVRHGIPKSGRIEKPLATTLRHAYLASVSYVDALIGKMLAALDESGAADNTIVIVWSDHGWHLGDMDVWGKATNYEIATRVPLMIHSPDMPSTTSGQSTEALVELVDMYPTLSELAGLKSPGHLEGQSFVPLMMDPQRPWKDAVFSQYPNPALREWAANPLTASMRETYFGPLIEEVEDRIMTQMEEQWDRDLFENQLMGYAMRTDRYRLVVWKNREDPSDPPLFVELYDHQQDPMESKNISSQRPDLVQQLLRQFDAGWQGNMAK
nr:sulfatase-like hydrolase/transferase [Saprospiraceae bacterium]